MGWKRKLAVGSAALAFAGLNGAALYIEGAHPVLTFETSHGTAQTNSNGSATLLQVKAEDGRVCASRYLPKGMSNDLTDLTRLPPEHPFSKAAATPVTAPSSAWLCGEPERTPTFMQLPMPLASAPPEVQTIWHDIREEACSRSLSRGRIVSALRFCRS